MANLIPEDWRRKVCAILQLGDGTKIAITQRARTDWYSIFPLLFSSDLYQAVIRALANQNVEGKKVSMNEAGEVYAFFFSHENIPLYGKINLRPDGTAVIIYSAHRPLKGDTL